MKTLEKIYKTLLLTLVIVTAVACSDDDDVTMAPAKNTIADFVVANQANYSLLLEALQKADGDLVTTLSSDGPFTVFAPTDTAFTELGDISGLTTDELRDILLYHVIVGREVNASAATAISGNTVEMGFPFL